MALTTSSPTPEQSEKEWVSPTSAHAPASVGVLYANPNELADLLGIDSEGLLAPMDELSMDELEPPYDEPSSPRAGNPDADPGRAIPRVERGAGKRTRGGASSTERQAMKKKILNEMGGGYTDKGRMAFKEEGGVLVSGFERTCLPDALSIT